MQVLEGFLKLADALVNFIIVLVLCVAGMYAAYALWDNNQVYFAAENVQQELMEFKPEVPSEPDMEINFKSFEELMGINSDICAWVTINNTKIDYPVLYGKNNWDYINKDVYGEYALAGSIFLDSRNDRTFQNIYSLLYGHHMENGSMFGDLVKFKEDTFFEENRTGNLILPDKVYNLEIFSCILTDAADETIFEPQLYEDDITALLDYAAQNSVCIDTGKMADLRQRAKECKILALSTCSYEFTDARTIILAEMKLLDD